MRETRIEIETPGDFDDPKTRLLDVVPELAEGVLPEVSRVAGIGSYPLVGLRPARSFRRFGSEAALGV
jgi:hypothetical protein